MSIRQGDDIISGNGSGLPKQTGKAGKYLKTDGTTVSWEDASTAQIWIGTKAEYDSLESYDDSIVYQIIDDYVDIKPINKNASRSIGELVYSTVPIIDAGLHLADGALLDGDGLYNEFYEYMVSVYNNGHTSIFTTENIWQTSVNTYGKCGKYVLDTTNHTIRLPKLSGFIEGTLNESEIGDLVEAGLPNITGMFDLPATYGSATSSGALIANTSGATGSPNNINKAGDLRVSIDASRSSTIYGNSATVQPESIKTYIYVVLANSIENIIELNVINELNNKADINLANTTAITNCITNIPQDIKLELNSGTLTLKAGSKLYRPNGDGVFDVVTIDTDMSFTPANNTMNFLCLNQNNNVGWMDVSLCYSGSSAPTGSQYMLWYDTTNNIIKFTDDNGSTWTSGWTLPFAVETSNTTKVTSLDQVFNDFGYIGSTVFALPRVKGLISNGRNEDGSLKNVEFETERVLVNTQTWNGIANICINSNDIRWTSSTKYYERENRVIDTDGYASNMCIIANVENVSGKIANFQSKTTFHAVDYNDTEYIAHQATPSSKYINLTLGASGSNYTAPADGYVYVSIQATNVKSFVYIGHREPETGFSITSHVGALPSNHELFLPVKKGQVFTVVTDYIGTVMFFRFIYANGAQ